MKISWIHEGDKIPQGFYIKRGALYKPSDYSYESYGFKEGKDGRIEQVWYGVEPSPFAKMVGPTIDWITLGFRFKRVHARIRFVNKPKGTVIFKSVNLI